MGRLPVLRMPASWGTDEVAGVGSPPRHRYQSAPSEPSSCFGQAIMDMHGPVGDYAKRIHGHTAVGM